MSPKRSISEFLIFRPEFIDPSLPTGLWWCGSAEDVSAVAINAVSKSIISDWDGLNACREWVEQFPYIFVAMPPSEQQQEVVIELQRRFSLPVLIADAASFRGSRSITELRKDAGLKAVDGLLLGAIELPMDGLLQVADVDTAETLPQKRAMSGILSLDYCVGGFRGGELSVWTGKRGEGKSTWLGQVLTEAVNQNHRVCAYSGELPSKQFKLSLAPQAAGPNNVKPVPDTMTGRTEYVVPKGTQERIDAWWRDRLLLTDIRQASAHDEETIIRLFEYAYRKYGCDVFLVDNIMTAELSKERELGIWRAQSAFTQRLSSFAKRHDAHVHLVAHPRKTGEKGVGADDVGGSGDITNLADNVFTVERVLEEQIEREGCSTRIRILKNRLKGMRETVALNFNEQSKRFFEIGGNPWKKYSWEMAK